VVRDKTFSSHFEFLTTLSLFFLGLFPLILAIRRFRSPFVRWFFDFRVLWLLSSLLVVFIGKGLFLHYFLLCVPPLVLISVSVYAESKIRPWETLWLGSSYALSCLLVTIPALSVTWGTDTPYFSRLAKAIQPAIAPSDSVLLWSGSPVLLTYLQSRPVTRFIVPRFAVPPYGTPETHRIFDRELNENLPDVIIDLHERGDNRFANPLESESALASLIQSYHLYVPPGIPWAKLYFRVPPPSKCGLVEITSLQMKLQAYRPFPTPNPAWIEFKSVIQTPSKLSVLAELKDLDKDLRQQQALELLSRQASDPDTRFRARTLLVALTLDPNRNPADFSKTIAELLNKAQAKQKLLPLISSDWWFTVSLAQMQPRTAPTPVVPVQAPLPHRQSKRTRPRL
jgi:hypothetical protein